jgi:hypothetical protein
MPTMLRAGHIEPDPLPLDVKNVVEVGWRKTRKTAVIYQWDEVQGDPDETPDFVSCKCGAMMIERKGKYGWFLGCSRYPDCKETQRL